MLTRWRSLKSGTWFVFFTTLVIMTQADVAFSQTWVRNFDNISGSGSSPGIATTILQTDDGGHVLFGIVGEPGEYAFRLTKINAFGSVVWSKLYLEDALSGVSFAWPGQLLATGDGGFLLLGTMHFTDANNGPCYSRNMGLIKVDRNGVVQWRRSYGLDAFLYTPPGGVDPECHDNLEEGKALVASGDGGYLLLGLRRTDPLAFPPAGQESQEYDLWLVKIDADGDILWQKSYGGAGRDWAQHATLIQVMGDGDIVIAGETDSWGTGGYAYDILVMRLDADGVLRWGRAFGSDQLDQAQSVVPMGDSVVVVAATGAFGVSGASEAWLVELNGAGSVVRQRAIEWDTGPGSPQLQVYPFKADRTPDGGMVVFGGMTVWSSWDYDPLLLKLDPTGEIDWGIRYDVSSRLSEWATAGDLTDEGGYVFGGYTWDAEDVMVFRTDAAGVVNDDYCDIRELQTLRSIETTAPVFLTAPTTLITTSPQWDAVHGEVPAVELVSEFCSPPPAPVIHAPVNPILFGDVHVGSFSDLSVEITNAGNANLMIVGVGPPSGSGMTLLSDGCTGFGLPPGVSCSLQVRFAPTSDGWHSATMLIQSDDPDGPNFVIVLQGHGGLGGVFAEGFALGDTSAWDHTVQ